MTDCQNEQLKTITLLLHQTKVLFRTAFIVENQHVPARHQRRHVER